MSKVNVYLFTHNCNILNNIAMDLKNIQIKETTPEDFNDIMEVEKLAFGYEKEAQLVADLLDDKTARPMISLLAFYNGEAVGHILFTRACFDKGAKEVKKEEDVLIHILAPLAVKPEFQRMGIGGMLIKKGIDLLRQMGSKLVFVLGHKEYYPKYGFIPDAIGLGYPAPYPILDIHREYWMVQTLSEDGFTVGKGKIRCSDVLNHPKHWRDDDADKV